MLSQGSRLFLAHACWLNGWLFGTVGELTQNTQVQGCITRVNSRCLQIKMIYHYNIAAYLLRRIFIQVTKEDVTLISQNRTTNFFDVLIVLYWTKLFNIWSRESFLVWKLTISTTSYERIYNGNCVIFFSEAFLGQFFVFEAINSSFLREISTRKKNTFSPSLKCP